MSVSPRSVAVGALLTAGLAVTALVGCKRRPPAPAPVPSAAAVSAVPSALTQPDDGTVGDGPAPAAQCRQLPNFGLTLEPEATPGAKSKPETLADEDDDALLPFGVDLGDAVATPYGFAVAGIRGAGRAFVALLGEQASRRVDLGELHGDAETPAIAASGADLLVALRSTDAAGFTIKLGRVAGPEGVAVEWGFELSKLGRAVTSVQLATGGARGVVVYQDEDKQGDSRIMVGSFATGALKEPFEVKAVAGRGAEMPRLTARPGGYWLSWVSTLSDAKPKVVSAPQKPSASPEPAPDPEERELLDVGRRLIYVAKLDERGAQISGGSGLGEPRRGLLMYDVAPLYSGGLLVVARSDSAVPGAEGGALVLNEVSPDSGGGREERLDDDELGAGAPALLADPDPQRPGPWLAMSSPSDATRLGVARGAHTTLLADALLGHAQVLAVSRGHFLVQRARGRSVTLSTLDCSWPNDNSAEKK